MISALKKVLNQYRLGRHFTKVLREWRAYTQHQVGSIRPEGMPLRLLVIPSDPRTLVGAKGDEAMILAVLSQVQAYYGEVKPAVITSSNEASHAAKNMGFEPIQAWGQGLSATANAILEFRPHAVAVLGADCMDGYYNPVTTLTMLALADITARQGAYVSVLGFSFNAAPDPRLKSVFESLHERVSVHLRDEVSARRFQLFCKRPFELVADSAFMLRSEQATDPVVAVASWVASQRTQGRCVLGFNFHPMLLGQPDAESVMGLIEQVAQALQSFMRSTPNTAIVLISHDYRGAIGDDACLKPLFDRLNSAFSDRIYYDEARCSASELKGIAGLMDGVLTGRMHLAIASLGMGVPVAALTYQDKFQGLMKHFDLPQDLLMAPEKLTTPGPLAELLKRFHDDLEPLRAKVAQHLGAVKQASARNVAPLLQVPQDQ